MSDSIDEIHNTSLERTPLYGLHVQHGARLVPFAGYEMPVHYAPGVLKEHRHVRAQAGLFDVSHMGQLAVRAKSGDVADAALALERLVPVDILDLKPGRQRYALFTNERGGILDDLMVAHRGDHLLLVVNAACKIADEAYLRQYLAETCVVERLNRALIALQGPLAATALERFGADVSDMRFMHVTALEIGGVSCVVSRSGYTGEDGFEISIPNDHCVEIASLLLGDERVNLIGLGARDSLRLEAQMCLYGSDLDETTTPVEANLAWAIQGVRRAGGHRAGGFPGDTIILKQLRGGASRYRVGLLPQGRAPIRAGAELFATETSRDTIGRVTSGGFGPSLDRPIAMGYLGSDLARHGTLVYAEVRGQRLATSVATQPFIAPNYKRA
ncbi:MAG: glycine cleavage system aminomethyltransferase GcvT [Hyphomicrobium sp.]